MSYLPYAFSLLGVPYGYWSRGTIPRDDSSSFYAVNAPPPSRAILEANGVSCTGFLNLLCRHLGLPVPGVEDPTESYPGGTGAWYKYLEPHLTPYDLQADYEDGTLLFRPYASIEDQGHIALVYNGKILHSYAYKWEPYTQNHPVDPGVSHTPPWKDGYFTYAAPPSAWLKTQ